MQLTQRNTVVATTEKKYFTTELKNPNKTDLQVCEAISLQPMCVKFCLNVREKGNLLFSRCQECLDWIQNLGLK